jgi:hypothetical protein
MDVLMTDVAPQADAYSHLLGHPLSEDDQDPINAAIRVDTNITWGLYVRRVDGNYDLAGVFPADSDRTIACQAADFREEAFAYHLAHELGAALEHDEDEVSAQIPFRTQEDVVSLYCPPAEDDATEGVEA